MRSSRTLLLGLLLAAGAAGAGGVAVAGTQPASVHVAPMLQECKVPPSELPPAGAHLTDAQIHALCNLPGAVRPTH